MANTAGFDVIAEMSLDTLSDLINRQPLTTGGQSIYLFGGKFLLTIPSSDGRTTTQFLCVASLQAVARTNTCSIVMALSDGSVVTGSHGIYHLGGTATIGFTIDWISDLTPNAPPGRIMPAAMLSQARASVKLDEASAAQFDANHGSGNSKWAELGMGDALGQWVRSQGNKPVPAFAFTFAPGRDSNDPTTVTARPAVCWIDGSTLGFLGYYRASGTGGNIFAKHDSDIVQPDQEFVYNQPGAVSVLPARRIAVLMSPQGFHLTVACPTLKSQIIRALVYQLQLPIFHDRVEATQYQSFYDQALKDDFPGHLNDSLQQFSGESYPSNVLDAWNQAIAETKADAENAVKVEASKELDVWLGSPQGLAAIDAATPLSCGNGSVEVSRTKMPDPLADVVASLTQLNLDLDKGFLKLSVQASGSFEGCGGFTVNQSAQLTAIVDALGRVVPRYNLGRPDVSIGGGDLCESIGAALFSYFTGGIWSGLIALGCFALAMSVVDQIVSEIMFAIEGLQLLKFPASGSLAVNPDLPGGAQLKEIDIDPTAFTVVALVGRDTHFNDYFPRFEVSASHISSTSTRPSASGVMHVKATKWGCPAGDFRYSEQFFENVVGVRVTAIGLPLPVTIDSWTIELGNFSYLIPGVRDIRPLWSGEVRPLAAPSVALAGECWFPVPPLNGQFLNKNDVAVTVSGDPNSGWQLGFQSQDGNFYVQVTVDGRDGDNNNYSASTWFMIGGDTIQFGQDYVKHQAYCSKLLWKWLQAQLASLSPIAAQAKVPPGAPVEGPESVVAQAVAQMVRAGNPATYSVIQRAVERYGEEFLSKLGAAPAGQQGGQVLR